MPTLSPPYAGIPWRTLDSSAGSIDKTQYDAGWIPETGEILVSMGYRRLWEGSAAPETFTLSIGYQYEFSASDTGTGAINVQVGPATVIRFIENGNDDAVSCRFVATLEGGPTETQEIFGSFSFFNLHVDQQMKRGAKYRLRFYGQVILRARQGVHAHGSMLATFPRVLLDGAAAPVSPARGAAKAADDPLAGSVLKLAKPVLTRFSLEEPGRGGKGAVDGSGKKSSRPSKRRS